MLRLQSLLKVVASLSLAAIVSAVGAQPVTIRVGHGASAEEPLWVMKAAPLATPGQGKAYNLEFNMFRGSDKRFQAFEAGELDIATGSTHSVLMAAAQGARFMIVASLSREGGQGFATRYMVREDSPIKTINDLKGKTVGINGARSSAEVWARLALEKKGLDTKRDVTWVALPFPNQGEAVRAGKLDIGAFPQPFAAFEEKRGGMRTVFTSTDGIGREEDLMVLMVSEKFAAQHPAALKAFLADLVSSTRYYTDKPKEAKQKLVESKLVSIPLDVFSEMKDYKRPQDARVDIDSLKAMTSELTKFGFITRPLDVASIVDMSYLPK